MTAGYAVVFLLSSATAFVPCVGLRDWATHLLFLAATLGWVVAGVALVARLSTGLGPVGDLALRLGGLAALVPAAAGTLGLVSRPAGLRPRGVIRRRPGAM